MPEISWNTFFGLIGIAGVLYQFYQAHQLRRAVKFGVVRHIRSMIAQLNSNKQQHKESDPAFVAMEMTQGQLENLSATLKDMVGISQTDANGVRY